MSSSSPLTKKRPLGVDPAIQKTIDAVQEVALNENVPTIIYPQTLPNQFRSPRRVLIAAITSTAAAEVEGAQARARQALLSGSPGLRYRTAPTHVL